MAYTSPIKIPTIQETNNFLNKKLYQNTAVQAPTPAPAVAPPAAAPAAPSVTVKPASPSAVSPVQAKQKFINDLSAKYGLNKGTVYDKSTNQGLTLDQFKTATGIQNPNWASLKFDEAYSPANQFVQAQMGGEQLYDPATGALTEAGRAKGLGDLNAPKSTGDTPKSAYLDFLRKQFDPSVLETTSKTLDDLSKRSGEEIARNRAEESRIRANEVGQVESGLNFMLNEEARKSNASLADIAIAKGYATDIYNKLLNAGASVFEAEEAARKEAKDAAEPIELNGVLYKPQADGTYRSILGNEKIETSVVQSGGRNLLVNTQTGEVIKDFGATEGALSRSSSSSSGLGGGYINPVTGTPELSPLARAVQNGTIPITSLSVKQRDAVAAELANYGAQSGRQQALQGNLDIVDSLLNNPNLAGISGSIQGRLPRLLLGAGPRLALSQFDQLKGTLSLENREKLKGTGAISDFEFKVLGDAASALNRDFSDADLKKQLEKIRDVFAGKYSNTNTGSPSGGNTVQVGNDFYNFPDKASADKFKKEMGL